MEKWKVKRYDYELISIQKALSIAKHFGDKVDEGVALANLGNSHYFLGDLKQSIEYHRKRLCIAKEIGDRRSKGRSYCMLGCALDRLGDSQEAIECHKQDLAIAKEIGDLVRELP